jgi:hypothetical protein
MNDSFSFDYKHIRRVLASNNQVLLNLVEPEGIATDPDRQPTLDLDRLYKAFNGLEGETLENLFLDVLTDAEIPYPAESKISVNEHRADRGEFQVEFTPYGGSEEDVLLYDDSTDYWFHVDPRDMKIYIDWLDRVSS